MDQDSTHDLGDSARRLRVDTMVRLRWLAIVGQSAAVVGTQTLLGFSLPVSVCFIPIAMSAWLNVGLRLRFPVNHRLRDGPAFLLLIYDLTQFSSLLFLTGGLTNPFVGLFLAPVTIAAVSLPRRYALGLGFIMIVEVTVLAVVHQPLPWYPEQSFSLPPLYVAAIWIAIFVTAAFIGNFVSRVATEARELAAALAATELVLAREQHLTQLDGLAAAAAHELGTPLATITLVVKELARHRFEDPALVEDIVLLDQEVQRCRTILGKIASLGNEPAAMMNDMTISHLLEEVVEPQRNFGVAVTIAKSGPEPEPICARSPGMLYGLGNLVENAIDFATSEVRINAEWTDSAVRIAIADDGPGFSPEVLMRLGEPYVTTRGPMRRSKSEEGSGLGLGLFIAKTLLERSGAAVTTTNAELPEQGARIAVLWPRATFEQGRASNYARLQKPAAVSEARVV